MKRETAERPDADWATAVLLLLALAWLFGVPVLLIETITTTPFLSVATEDQLAEHHTWATVTLICAVALPVSGFLVAVNAQRNGWVGFFGVASTIGLLALFLSLYNSADDNPTPSTPTSTRAPYCAEHSGGDTTCPGG